MPFCHTGGVADVGRIIIDATRTKEKTLGRELYIGLCRTAFEHCAVTKIETGILRDNTKSLSMFRSIGAVITEDNATGHYLATIEKHDFYIHNAPLPLYKFCLDRKAISKSRILLIRTSITADIIFRAFSLLNDREKMFDLRMIGPHEVDRQAIIWSDVVFIFRGFDFYSKKIAQMAKSAGRLVVFYLDDNLLDLHEIDHYTQRRCNLLSLQKSMDVLCTPNRLIAEKYALDKKAIVDGSCNIFSDTERGIPNKGISDAVKVVVAAVDRKGPVQTLIVPIMGRLFEKYGERISFTFIGVDPDVSSMKEKSRQIEKIPFIPYGNYNHYFLTTPFDIGLAPNSGGPLARYKNYGKYLTYAAHGILAICPNSEPYTWVVNNGENGLLAECHAESWYEAICRAIDDVELRNRCTENAYQLIQNEFSVEQRAAYFRQDFAEILSYKANPHVTTQHIRGCAVARYYYAALREQCRNKPFIKFIKEDFYRMFLDIFLAVKKDTMQAVKKQRQADMI